MSKAKITKTTVEIYKIRFESGLYWANFTVDDLGEKGRIQIASDFGSWQYYWNGCGCPFKEFLTQLEIEYTAGKFGESRWFDHEATIKQFKIDILQARRSGDIDEEIAKELWNEIPLLEDATNQDVFANEIHSMELFRFYNFYPEMETSISPQFAKFWKICWSEFRNCLLAEMKERLVAV